MLDEGDTGTGGADKAVTEGAVEGGLIGSTCESEGEGAADAVVVGR